MNGRPNSDTKEFYLFMGSCMVLSAICYGVAAAMKQPDWPETWQRTFVIVLIICNAATIPPVLLTWGAVNGRVGVTSTMFTMLWRLGTLIAVLIFWSATKWPPAEFAAKCLVGCYFPFLLLESWHSIRRTAS